MLLYTGLLCYCFSYIEVIGQLKERQNYQRPQQYDEFIVLIEQYVALCQIIFITQQRQPSQSLRYLCAPSQMV